MHATDYLRSSDSPLPGVVVLSGTQRGLKHDVLARLKGNTDGEEENTPTQINGKEAELSSVTTELRTVSMWGGRRIVVIDGADDFVSKSRAGIEKLVEKPPKNSLLVLLVESWPKNTRLYKQVAAAGGEIDCSPLTGAALFRWLNDTAKDRFQKSLAREAASLLITFVGEDLGLLEQELSKLASYVGSRDKIDAEDVRSMVVDWRVETTWAMVDSVRDGQVGAGMAALNQLMAEGEAAQKLLGGISYVLRKLALGTELSRKMPLEDALRSAAVFPKDVGVTVAYLRRLGRPRAERLMNTLLAADRGLKGSSALPDRTQLELLLLRLSGQAD